MQSSPKDRRSQPFNVDLHPRPVGAQITPDDVTILRTLKGEYLKFLIIRFQETFSETVGLFTHANVQ